MKTFFVTFAEADGTVVATAEATFDSLPSEGEIRWEGDLTRLARTPRVGYSASFEGWMQATADQAGLTLTVKDEGDWEVYDE